MNKIGFVLLPLALAGCANSAGDTTYYVEFTPGETPDCSISVSENFTDAEPREDADTSSDWTLEEGGEASPTTFFVQVIEGAGGEAWLVHGNTVYRGEAKGKELVFSWDNFDNSTREERHVSGYQYTSDVQESFLTTWTLTKGKGGTMTGKISVDSVVDSTWSENDEWSYDQTGVYSGAITTPANRYLRGSNENTAENADCDGGTCTISVTSECTGEDDVLLIKTKLGNESAYEGLENAGMPGGTGGQ